MIEEKEVEVTGSRIGCFLSKKILLNKLLGLHCALICFMAEKTLVALVRRDGHTWLGFQKSHFLIFIYTLKLPLNFDVYQSNLCS